MNTGNRAYCITASSWCDATDESRNDFSMLLKADPAHARYFCRIYLEKFLLIHEIAHIIQSEFSDKYLRESDKEYEANLFALKYFEYKHEETFLKELYKCIDTLIGLYSIKIAYHPVIFDDLLSRYKFDRKSYGLLQFVLINEAVKSSHPLENVVAKISNNGIIKIDYSIQTKKGLVGKELIEECLSVVYGKTGRKPKIELEYLQRLGFQTLEEIF